jgi:hypothetical protein
VTPSTNSGLGELRPPLRTPPSIPPAHSPPPNPILQYFSVLIWTVGDQYYSYSVCIMVITWFSIIRRVSHLYTTWQKQVGCRVGPYRSAPEVFTLQTFYGQGVVSLISSKDLLGATMSFLGFPNGLLARLCSTSPPIISFHHFQATSCRAVSNRPRRPAPHPPTRLSVTSRVHHHPLPLPAPRGRCLHACRLASTSPSTSAQSTSSGSCFSATRLMPKSKRLRCPGGVGHFRPFPNGIRAASRVSELQKFATFGPIIV